MTAMSGTKPSSGRTRALTSHHRGPDQVGETGEPLVERRFRVHDDLELAARQAAHAALAGPEWNDHMLAVDPHRVGDREDLVDLAHPDGVEHPDSQGPCRTSAGRRSPPGMTIGFSPSGPYLVIGGSADCWGLMRVS